MTLAKPTPWIPKGTGSRLLFRSRLDAADRSVVELLWARV
jgi:hypothetical protein